MQTKSLSWGLGQAVPEEVTAAWGARLIWPADLLWDRQDLWAADDESKNALVEWLNGQQRGNGALKKALDEARRLADSYELRPSDETVVVLYEDEHGKIVASPRASYGYLYAAAWLKSEEES